MVRRTCLILAALGLAACQTPDRRGVFDLDYEGQLQREARRAAGDPVAVPDEVQPTPDPRAALQLPTGDGPLDLAVEQAVFLAVQNNRDLEVQSLNPVIVGTFEQIERGVYDPELFADYRFSQQEATETSRATADQFSVRSEENATVAGVRQQLPTGTAVEATAGTDRTFSNRTPDQHAPRLGLSVTQQLLQGLDPAVNLASIRQAELDTLASVYELRGFTEALIAEVETTYWTYALGQQAITIVEQSLQLARQQRDEVEARIDVGVIPRTEGAAARAEVAQREQALINARSLAQTQRLRLLRLINAQPDDSLHRDVRIASPTALDAQPLDDVPLRVQLAQRARPDLQEALLRLEQDRLETLVTRNGLLPRLEVFMAVGKTGYAEAFGDAVRDMDGSNFDFTAGAGFTYALGNRTAEARDLAARATRQQSAAAVANLRQIITLDVHLACTEVERARQQIAATAATRALREETLRAEEERFRVGASTSLLVAQAQRDLVQSQIDELEAVIGYRIALIDLYVAEGTLLQRRGIDLAATERDAR